MLSHNRNIPASINWISKKRVQYNSHSIWKFLLWMSFQNVYCWFYCSSKWWAENLYVGKFIYYVLLICWLNVTFHIFYGSVGNKWVLFVVPIFLKKELFWVFFIFCEFDHCLIKAVYPWHTISKEKKLWFWN